ncbi:hypothetical protein [Saccharopolyspora antimicrobica]|uniref:hypothetical protein n=1 Tax=Saccharopolyspora antimicrobica TaxID=455193 RepID=UPI001160D6D4|nr:hypothetical protein [Saccharopolyspora antimicrobica]
MSKVDWVSSDTVRASPPETRASPGVVSIPREIDRHPGARRFLAELTLRSAVGVFSMRAGY